MPFHLPRPRRSFGGEFQRHHAQSQGMTAVVAEGAGRGIADAGGDRGMIHSVHLQCETMAAGACPVKAVQRRVDADDFRWVIRSQQPDQRLRLRL